MDTSNWRPTEGGSAGGGDSSMESGDWRSWLPADSRERVVNKIVDNLKGCVPYYGHEGLQEVNEIAVRFEEKVYAAATSQSDYLRKLSLEMLYMEIRSQSPLPDAMQSYSTANSVNPSDPASLDSKTTGTPNVGDWQEEVYQKIKAMKDLYLLDLNDMHQKILRKLQQHDSLPQQPKNEQLEKLKVFKNMLERFMAFLQIPKHNVLASYKDKLGVYEKQIVLIINSNRRKPAATATQQQTQALPPPHLPSVQQQSQQTHSQVQPHENQMNSQMQTVNLQGVSMASMQQNNMGSLQQNSVSSVRGAASNAQQNMMSSIQPNSNLDPGNSLQQVSGRSLQQNAAGLKSIIKQEMDTSNWRPTPGGSGGDSSMECGDWRSKLQADFREMILNNIVDTLKRHVPLSGHEGLQELGKIAMRFEEKIYIAATSQSDYLHKISLKMLTMETGPQNPMPDERPVKPCC